MKTLFKLFIVAAFTIISAGVYAQNISGQEKKGKIVEMNASSISIFDYETGEIVTSHLWSRPGALVVFKVGDEVSYIVIILRNTDPYSYIIQEIYNAQ